MNNTIYNNYFIKDSATGWDRVNPEALVYKDQAIAVEQKCTSDANMQRLKAVAKAAVAGGSALILGGLAYLALKIASLAIGILVFPLAIIPPLYGLVTTLTGVGVGVSLLYLSTKKYSKPFFEQAKEHWNHADHLYNQAFFARTRVPALATAKA